MNVEYILLISLNAMQIKASSDVAYDFNQVIYAVCAPPRRFRPLHRPTPSHHVKQPSLLSLVKTHIGKLPQFFPFR